MQELEKVKTQKENTTLQQCGKENKSCGSERREQYIYKYTNTRKKKKNCSPFALLPRTCENMTQGKLAHIKCGCYIEIDDEFYWAYFN
jgi:hypothetical protein